MLVERNGSQRVEGMPLRTYEPRKLGIKEKLLPPVVPAETDPESTDFVRTATGRPALGCGNGR
jgi:hypothetical protein